MRPSLYCDVATYEVGWWFVINLPRKPSHFQGSVSRLLDFWRRDR